MLYDFLSKLRALVQNSVYFTIDCFGLCPRNDASLGGKKQGGTAALLPFPTLSTRLGVIARVYPEATSKNLYATKNYSQL
jgi:hypothetical protein